MTSTLPVPLTFFSALFAAFILMVPGSAEAQSPSSTSEPLEIPRLSGPIQVDGVIDEPAWEAVPALPLTMFSPTFGGEMTEHSEVRVAHDGEYLYVSGRLYDSDPDGIQTNTFYRNQYSGDDVIAVVLDSFNDHETAVWFITNPAGARSDRTVSNDAVFSGGMPMNTDWNAHWDVATTQTDEGWFAEFRIPFSSFGFQARDGEVTMGLIVYRFIARKNERQIFPAIDPAWGGLAFAKPSQARRIRLEGVRQETPVYVTPYTLFGAGRTPELVGPVGQPTGWEVASDRMAEVGLDLKVSPVPNLSLDLTLNTDFAQVEADVQQINLTRFPLFFPEKRQFFQERSSTFQFNAGGGMNRLFHSRRIGLEGGEPVRIYGGGRAVGRLGGADFGLLSMQTAGGPEGSPENLSVARLSQQVFNPYSSVGAMVTSRLGSEGRDNIAYGLDGQVRLFGDEWVSVKWARSYDERIDEGSELDGGVIQGRWERIRDEGLSYSADAIRVGTDYNPGLGFQNRRGFNYLGGRVQYKRFQGADSPFRSTAWTADAGRFARSLDGTTESGSMASEGNMEFKGGTTVRLRAERRFEDVRNPFQVAGLPIEPGEFTFHSGEFRLQMARSRPLRGNLTAGAGQFYDGGRWSVNVSPTWNPSKYLELSGGLEVNRLGFSDRDAAVTAGLAQFNTQFALNTSLSLSVFAQYSNVADLTTLNARFRYHFREGTDLWVVLNEGVHMDREAFDGPLPPRSAGRNLMIKYTHTLIF